eukprot:g16689.t1
MSQSKGKFVIKPPRPRNHMDERAAQVIWDLLSTAIGEIHNKNASSLSFEELYRNAYNLVLHKHGDLLYAGVKQSVQAHLDKVGEKIAEATDDRLLHELSEQWGDHQVTMQMVRDILMYMDRTYVSFNKKMPVYEMGLVVFRDTVARHEKVKGRLQTLLLQNIADERASRLIDRDLMKTSLSMLSGLGVDGVAVYEEDFENDFLATTRAFYRAESQEYIARNTCPAYMKKAEDRLGEEAARSITFLAAGTEPKLKHIVETELIQNHAKVLVEMENSGCTSMFRDDKIEDLRRMYDLFSRVPMTLDELRRSMCEYVKATGKALVTDQESAKDPVAFVQGLLSLRDKYDAIVNDAFRGEKRSQKRLKEAFEDFINTDSRCASYLATYVDDLLKSGLRGMAEDQAEAMLEKVIVIFRYLQDKDVFENFYKTHLSKRLLGGRSVSDEMEKNMIVKLKNECGYQFTSKLEGMFTDMKISKDVMEEYRKTGRHTKHGLELVVEMLTTGYWPTQSGPKCSLPKQVVRCCKEFEEFYLQKHNGRKVTWQTSQGNADLKSTFGKNRHDLNVSTQQMCILLLFNHADVLSYAEIQDATQIGDPELKRHLISLCTPKFRVLRKGSKGKGIAGPDDTFSFNADFTSKLKRVRIPLVSIKDSTSGPAASAALPPAVEEDRRHLTEAAVVRIMKARKTLRHNDLVAEVTRQLSSRFVPSPTVIKSRIESLIDREYLERDRNDRRAYNYLA